MASEFSSGSVCRRQRFSRPKKTFFLLFFCCCSLRGPDLWIAYRRRGRENAKDAAERTFSLARPEVVTGIDSSSFVLCNLLLSL